MARAADAAANLCTPAPDVGGAMDAAMRDGYGVHVRPEVMAKLRALRLDVIFDRAEGSRLWGRTAAGRAIEVVDFVGGYGATLFGHNHPVLLAAMRDALDRRLPFCAQASVRGPAGLLGRALSDRLARSTGEPGYVITLANSGTEVVEAAIKHAELERHAHAQRQLSALRDAAVRARRGARHGQVILDARLYDEVEAALGASVERTLEGVIAAVETAAVRSLGEPGVLMAVAGAFHGKTMGALRVTHNPAYRDPWPHLGHAVFVPLDDEATLAAAVAATRRSFPTLVCDDTGPLRVRRVSYSGVTACFAEPIQGEGGVRALSPSFLRALRRHADEDGFPLVLDEIQCGMGRTGTFLAAEDAGVSGDYYLLAKSLGGGIAKIGALAVATSRYQREFGYLHTATFADDDWSATVALAALALLDADDGGILRQCHEKGVYLRDRLQALVERHPTALAAVRGRGLMLGLELADQRDSTSTLLRALAEQDLVGYVAAGYLLNEEGFRVAPSLSAPTTIRIQPPYCVDRREMDDFVAAIERFARLLENGDLARLVGFAMDAKAPAGARRQRRARETTSATAPRSTSVAPAARRVGFLAHLITPEDLHHLDPLLSVFGRSACAEFLDRTAEVLQPIALPPVVLRSPTGARVELEVIAVPFSCEQAIAGLRSGEIDRLTTLVHSAVELARGRGCEVLGFGGYTSILTDSCRAIAEDRIALTSGNSLTVAAGISALWSALAVVAPDMTAPRIGVVGATGNIGAMLAEIASERAGEIVLYGRPGSRPRLERLRPRLRCPSRVETDLHGLAGCAGILTATNAPAPVILPAHVGAGPMVICDLAVPQDVSPAVSALPGIRVIRGGLLRLPLEQSAGVAGLAPAPGCVYACLAETLLMGFEGVDDHLSYGALHGEGVQRAWRLAEKHQFTLEERPAAPAWR